MLQPGLPPALALTGAVLFYLGHQAVGAAVSFPAGWLADRVGRVPILALAYLSFGVACATAAWGHGVLAVVLLAIPVGIQAPLVVAMESSLVSSLVPERVSGTAFGVLAGVNGAGDLVSSVSVGVLWSTVGAPVALALGAVLALAATALLLARRGKLSPASAGAAG
jgi:MFS family permease